MAQIYLVSWHDSVVFIFLASTLALLSWQTCWALTGEDASDAAHCTPLSGMCIRLDTTLSGMCITTRADIICLTLIVGEAKDRKEVVRL